MNLPTLLPATYVSSYYNARILVKSCISLSPTEWVFHYDVYDLIYLDQARHYGKTYQYRTTSATLPEAWRSFVCTLGLILAKATL